LDDEGIPHETASLYLRCREPFGRCPAMAFKEIASRQKLTLAKKLQTHIEFQSILN
jgi:hypothetical protein